MKTRNRIPFLTASLAVGLSVMLLSGCNGPTKAGKEARSAARERLDAINARLSFDQASQAFSVGDLEKAEREIAMAIRRYPDEPEFHLLLGRIHLESHRLETAIQAFETAIEKDAEFADAHYFAGIVHQRWSKYEEAYESYTKAAEYDPTNVQYLLAAAESKIALGEYDSAEAMIVEKLDYFEHNAALRHLLGQIALLKDDTSGAARLLGEARLLNPENESLLEELAWTQFAAGDFRGCLESVKQLQHKSVVKRADLLHMEARCLVFLERGLEARNLFNELTRLAPNDPEIWIEFGALAWELGDQRRVAQCSARAIALAPNRFEGYILKSLYEQHAGRTGESLSLLKTAVELADDSTLPLLMYGRSLEQAGESREALVAYSRVLQQDPANADALMLYERLNQQMLSSVPVD